MEPALAALDASLAALMLAGSILLAVVALTIVAGNKDNLDTQKNMFAIVGVLVGILAGGGVGTILGTQAGETAANDVKQDVQAQVDEAGEAAADDVKQDVQAQVQKAAKRR